MCIRDRRYRAVYVDTHKLSCAAVLGDRKHRLPRLCMIDKMCIRDSFHRIRKYPFQRGYALFQEAAWHWWSAFFLFSSQPRSFTDSVLCAVCPCTYYIINFYQIKEKKHTKNVFSLRNCLFILKNCVKQVQKIRCVKAESALTQRIYKEK